MVRTSLGNHQTIYQVMDRQTEDDEVGGSTRYRCISIARKHVRTARFLQHTVIVVLLLQQHEILWRGTQCSCTINIFP